jgi:hypothetical protein
VAISSTIVYVGTSDFAGVRSRGRGYDGDVLRIEGAGRCYLLYSPSVFKNFDICPHLKAKGLPGALWRLNLETPVINRSDGSRFHLSLFSGAENVPTHSGRIAGNGLLGDFRCVHDEFGDSASLRSSFSRIQVTAVRVCGDSWKKRPTSWRKYYKAMSGLLSGTTSMALP